MALIYIHGLHASVNKKTKVSVIKELPKQEKTKKKKKKKNIIFIFFSLIDRNKCQFLLIPKELRVADGISENTTMSL